MEPPAGGTGMGETDSAETLLPVTYTPMKGVGRVDMGGLLFAQNYDCFHLSSVLFLI